MDANFGQKGSLNRHLNINAATVHEEKNAFKCGICNAEFSSKPCMKGHITTIHEGN